MISLMRKLLAKHDDRLFFAGIIVIAANAGGAWSPIGDVTTTMLWIGGQITSLAIIKAVLLPSLVSMLVPLGITAYVLRGQTAIAPARVDSAVGLRTTVSVIGNFEHVGILNYLAFYFYLGSPKVARGIAYYFSCNAQEFKGLDVGQWWIVLRFYCGVRKYFVGDCL